MILVDDFVFYFKVFYDKLEYLFCENLKELCYGYIREWFFIESFKCFFVIFLGYNESNVSEIIIKLESKLMDVKFSKGVYEDIILERKCELIKKCFEVLIVLCDSEFKIWLGKMDLWWLLCGECFSLDKQDYRIILLYFNVVNNDNEYVGLCYCDLCVLDNKSLFNFSCEFKIFIIFGVLFVRVVGFDFEEYYIDDNGCVKISFFWGEKLVVGIDKIFCWVCVFQVWFGEGFGSQFIFCIGSEVLVSFIQGNFDYLVIVGIVYNGQNILFFFFFENNCKFGFIICSVKNGKKGEGY